MTTGIAKIIVTMKISSTILKFWKTLSEFYCVLSFFPFDYTARTLASPINRAAGSDLGGRGGVIALDLDQEGEEGGAHDGDGDGRPEIRTVVITVVTTLTSRAVHLYFWKVVLLDKSVILSHPSPP